MATTTKSHMTQKERIHNYLNSGKSINPVTAFNRFGVYRLGAIIYRLKEDGYDIDTTMVTVKNHLGRRMLVASYKLA